ncbi:response regulator transcription factor [Pseudobacteroides cellulosolvens]|uniref:Stage 0 sporulation protein A homolog n=1 Tax=Pseudobacteroides cellulosolvens ATCC 35603 = DSM 2933 TaxID=398512 RepID=A0A0L6JVZ9_9FIRM|nr:response regulator [Pseudobacteroides cellulosolvens]KNY29785.1 two component transcriptional regulator, AraC family [Pseudobacteroides cellulosolvens ATCC 35603 = DSM 2933]
MYRVLIVDDDRAVRYMLKRFKCWDLFGFMLADEACDGKEALNKLQADEFDIVISDIKMPGIDGIEFLSELRSMKNDICVLFLSTHSDFSYAKQGIRLGVFDYLIKPLKDEALCEALERVKVYLDGKNKQKGSSERGSIFLENIQAFYSKNDEKKLVSDILSGSLDAVNKGRDICNNLIDFMGVDPARLAILLENIISDIDESIYKLFPWIKEVESIVSIGVFKGDDTILIERQFLDYISSWVRIISKYELHQPDSLMRKICEYVLNHIEDDVKVETIANELYVNRDYIGKVFKQKAGYHLSEYITKVKMEHAKYLMSKGRYKNYEISEKLGYKKPDYFTQLFKGYTGYTPTEYRKFTV